MTKVIERLLKSLRDAARYNPDVQGSPACILWPDRGRQWEAVIPRLQIELPELIILGDYDPEKRTGPAIWLRCAIAGKTDDLTLPSDRTPIIYLPGVSRQDLRAVESCPDHLKPLAELQYRGVIWSQLNTRDWTILAFLKSGQGGLGLDVSQDSDTKNGMQLALHRLLDEEVDLLKDKRLDKDYFNTMLTGGDPVRDLLQWLDNGDAFREIRDDNEWRAFVEVCKSKLAFNPEDDGIIAGATKLAVHEGPWRPVWERFCEAPKRYPNIPANIRKCKAPENEITWYSGDCGFDGWPQWNEVQENKLRKDLELLDSLPPHKARESIEELEKRNGTRRNLVWAELGEAPLSIALEHLSVLAQTTSNSLAAGNIDELAAMYRNYGWKADDALVRALASVKKHEDVEVVKAAIRDIYLPWAERSAKYLQEVAQESGYPSNSRSTKREPLYKDGECVFFVDGLRFDAAKRLEEMLTSLGYQVDERNVWAALPSVTATGKPTVSPVRSKIGGSDVNADFEPCIAESGKSLRGGTLLKKLLTQAGWEVLDRSSNGDGKGNAWCEFGNIDREGHDRGWELATHLEDLLEEIRDRVIQLLESGWKSVRIVTDHGWLLLPGGLPKIELPTPLTETKWGRCAVIKPGASTEERLYPWYWNSNQYFALADGIKCFRNGSEYSHGGLSLQECLNLELIVLSGSSPASRISVEIAKVVWKGLRCNIIVTGEFDGLSLDLRKQPGNPSSSVVLGVKPLKEDGKASVVVENEEMEGNDATIVILDPNGELVAQLATIIGGVGE
jgi:hypothetical protein